MAVEWRDVALGDLFKVKHGFAFKGEFFTDQQQSEILVTPGNFAIGGGFQDEKRKYYRGPVPTDYVLQPGQIVVTMTDLSKQSDTLGFAARIPNDANVWLHNQRVGLLVFNPSAEADARFVEYLLRSHEYRAWVIGSATGTTVKHTSPSRIEAFRTLVPPPTEQRAIAHILGTLDDKIELNRRRNQTLEAMARALFKDWFVDFGPVRAKMEGREPYLPADLWQLFPDRLDDEGKPEGWAYLPVGEFAELKGGKQLEKEKIAPSGPIPVFGGAGVMGYTDSHNADGFVIAVGRVGAYCGQFFSHRGKAWINNNASLIKQTDDDLAEWLFLSLSHADIDVIKKGAAQPFVSNGDIAKLPLVWPTEGLVRAFTDIVGPVQKKKDQHNVESRALAQLRDTLLPKLISGELRVKDAERFIERAS
jgi:type I restriction enzyme S subunit